VGISPKIRPSRAAGASRLQSKRVFSFFTRRQDFNRNWVNKSLQNATVKSVFMEGAQIYSFFWNKLYCVCSTAIHQRRNFLEETLLLEALSAIKTRRISFYTTELFPGTRVCWLAFSWSLHFQSQEQGAKQIMGRHFSPENGPQKEVVHFEITQNLLGEAEHFWLHHISPFWLSHLRFIIHNSL